MKSRRILDESLTLRRMRVKKRWQMKKARKVLTASLRIKSNGRLASTLSTQLKRS